MSRNNIWIIYSEFTLNDDTIYASNCVVKQNKILSYYQERKFSHPNQHSWIHFHSWHHGIHVCSLWSNTASRTLTRPGTLSYRPWPRPSSCGSLPRTICRAKQVCNHLSSRSRASANYSLCVGGITLMSWCSEFESIMVCKAASKFVTGCEVDITVVKPSIPTNTTCSGLRHRDMGIISQTHNWCQSRRRWTLATLNTPQFCTIHRSR